MDTDRIPEDLSPERVWAQPVGPEPQLWVGTTLLLSQQADPRLCFLRPDLPPLLSGNSALPEEQILDGKLLSLGDRARLSSTRSVNTGTTHAPAHLWSQTQPSAPLSAYRFFLSYSH